MTSVETAVETAPKRNQVAKELTAAKRQVDAAMKLLYEQNLSARNRIDAKPNPFVYKEISQYPRYETFKTVVLGLTLAPIRLLIVFMLLVVLALLSRLSIAFGYDQNQPMSPIRKAIIAPRTWIIRLILFVFGVYWIDIQGQPDDDARFVVIAPHSTFLDQFLVGYVSPGCAVAKSDVLKAPLFRSLFLAGQTIFVDRQDKNAKATVLKEFERRAADERWPKIVLFPEGTCTNRKVLITFRTGAFVTGHKVQPILLKWSCKHFDPTWTASGKPSRLKLIFRLACQFTNRCSVEFLPARTPTEEERIDPILFANNVRASMAAKLGVETTDHSYEDTFMALEAKKQKLDPSKTLNFEFKQLRKLFDISSGDAQLMLKRFAKAKGAKTSGVLSVHEFAEILNAPLTNEVAELFAVLDVDHSQELNFRDFIIGMTFLSRNTTSEESVKVLFKLLDPTDTGKVNVKDLHVVLSRVFGKIDEETIQVLFDFADTDKSGSLDFNGLLQFVAKHPEYLYLGIEMGSRYKLRNERINSITKEEAEALMRGDSGICNDLPVPRVEPEGNIRKRVAASVTK